MPFPKVTNGRVDPQLSNISLAYTNEEYIHDKILPVVPNLKDESGKVAEFGTDHLRIYSTAKRSLWDEGEHRIDYTIDNSKTYEIDYYDLDIYVPDRLADQLQKPFDAKKDASMNLEGSRNQIMESAIASALQSTAVITQNVTLSGTDQWSDLDDSDPLADLETGAETIRQATGRRPNRLILPARVVSKLIVHTAFKARVSGVQKTLSRADVVNIIAAHLNIKEKNILIGSAIKESAKEGQTSSLTDIWGDGVVLFYVPERASLMTPSLGYRFELTGKNKRVVTRRHKNDKGDLVEIDWAYEDKILDTKNAYLINDTLA